MKIDMSKSLLVNGITLLSVEEYRAAKDYISVIDNWWWLRSPGYFSACAAYVNAVGSVEVNGSPVDYTEGAVRPALMIENLRYLNLKPGDKILDYAGYDWTVIPGHKALCDTSIWERCFQQDWRMENSNDYEKSDIKKWLENWAKERGIICRT